MFPDNDQNQSTDTCNYRPISILHTIAKIPERVVYEQLSYYFTSHHLFPACQHGFRHNHLSRRASTAGRPLGNVLPVSAPHRPPPDERVRRRPSCPGKNCPAACCIVRKEEADTPEHVLSLAGLRLRLFGNINVEPAQLRDGDVVAANILTDEVGIVVTDSFFQLAPHANSRSKGNLVNLFTKTN